MYICSVKAVCSHVCVCLCIAVAAALGWITNIKNLARHFCQSTGASENFLQRIYLHIHTYVCCNLHVCMYVWMYVYAFKRG